MRKQKNYHTLNPATGELVKEYPFASDSEIENAVALSQRAHEAWKGVSVEDRAQIVLRISELFIERCQELASVATTEMGKAIEEMHDEIEFCSDIFRYYASHGPKQLDEEILKDEGAGISKLQIRPVGPLLGVMPWNYPYYQVARFVAPNLVAGNTILLKHAEICPASALALSTLFEDAGVPSGVYQNIFATYDQVASIIANPAIQGVSLTGSERAGAAIAEQAGRHLKKAVLELGGSDPYIVLSTDDVAAQARHALSVRLENTGQACNSNKRIIVQDEFYEDFLAELVQLVENLYAANPTEGGPGTYGPLSSEDALESVLAVVKDAVESGATLHVGGQRLDRAGFYVAPAVLTGVAKGSRAYGEEIFGPVFVVHRVASEEEALRVANDTSYGLGAAVYAAEPGRAEIFADQLEAGMVGSNAQPPETADLPFGGIKRSGYGRELGSLGIYEFVNKRLMHHARAEASALTFA